MKRPSLRSAAPVAIATMAVAVMLGGTAYAAAKVNGKDIAKHSISGNRLKHNTVTGSQIKESSLGAVPKAKTATTALSAATVDGAVVQTFSLTVAETGRFRPSTCQAAC